MKEKYLITGINGFVGSHVADLLVRERKSIVGMIQKGTDTQNINHLLDSIDTFESDLLDKEHLSKEIASQSPSVILNFAGQSSNILSFKEPELTHRINFLGTLNLLEAVRIGSPETKVVLIGSSEEYGIVPHDLLPIHESCPLKPASPYATSKVAAEILGRSYFNDFGVGVVSVRSFNQEGPRRPDTFALSSFAKQIVDIEKRSAKPEIFVGNLDVTRDLTDVRDAACAYKLISEKGKLGETYNMCSGIPRNMGDVLGMLVGLSTAKDIKISTDPSRVRKSENPVFYGDNGKLRRDTGWKPEVTFEKTLNDMLDYWRNI
jgi:GDP-4-dehydro-6-deoxy-D-mannose reductase